MKINRAVVKQQAQEIIKGNVFKLFIISFIVGILAGGSSSINFNHTTDLDDLFDRDRNPFAENYDEDGDNFGFDEFTTEYDENFFNEFDGNGRITLHGAIAGMPGVLGGALAFAGVLSIIAALVLGPLKIMLAGLYSQLVRGNNMSFGDGLGFVFKKTFDKDYIQKFLLNLVQAILLGLLYICFIIPGIIFNYKWYFTAYIMAENPELTFEQAMNTSKKMTNNHKGELFVLDLSFIPWYLLMIPTIGLVSIYLTPYVSTTHALYYENFKARALQEGAITQYDFMSSAQQIAAQAQTAPQMNTYAQPQENTYYTPAPQAPQQDTYYTPVAPQPAAEQYYQPAAPVAPQPAAEPVDEPIAEPTAEPVSEPVAETFESPAEAPTEEYYTPTEPPQSTEE
ncbi:MAG: DUF975 family protein [Ruminococcaceae bacterium]|nr:DUF975 family protein [Oscillospiraceae bacterium]